MPKAVEQTNAGLTIGHALLALGGNQARMTVRQAVHDGDTVNVDPDGNLGVRLLGVDAAESSFNLPGRPPNVFVSIKAPEWVSFLTDPFAPGLPPFDPPLPAALLSNLRPRVGPNCAANHAHHADAAQRAFENLISADMAEQGMTKDTFKFFLAFASEVIDRYGRFLAFTNRDQPDGPRPLSYNDRLLGAAVVTPYFIWPNINPFRRQPNLLDAVPTPNSLITDPTLDRARQAIAAARAINSGVFTNQAPGPLALLPFELRYLARTARRPDGQIVRRGPDRWVVDLTAGDDQLLPPDRYIDIPNWEDRLFIPAEYIPLFIERSWRRA